MLTQLLADLRYAARSLARAPLFTAVAVISMAFGIGANAAVFTLVDQVVLRSLPVAEPGRLVQVSAIGTESYGGGMGDGTELSYPMYRDLRDRNDVFTGMFCRMSTALHVSDDGRSERAIGELVSSSFFPVLGLRPAIGRLLTHSDDKVNGEGAVAVLGYDYWRSRFSADPLVVGRTIVVNGHPLEIVGVVQPGFAGIDIGRPVQVYVPISMQPKMGPPWLDIETRRFRWVQVFGRLRAGVAVEQAQVGLQPLYRSLLGQEVEDAAFARASADTKKRFLAGTLTVEDASRGHSGLRESVSEPLLILMAIAGGVLLIVCANVANLLVARGAARSREVALRLAVGAGFRDIVRLLLVESLVLASLGAALGLVLAGWGAEFLLRYVAPPDGPLAVRADPDARVLLFTIALAVATALLAGLVPALRGTRVDLAPALKGPGGAVLGEQPRLRKALVVAQVALSFTLLIGAGLFLRSLQNLLEVDPGFRTQRTVAFSLDLARSGYDAERAHAFAVRLFDLLQKTPGVVSAGYVFVPLLEGGAWGMGFTIEGYRPAPGEFAGALCNAVSPGYFKAMGIPLLAGREFDTRDDRVRPRPEGWPYRVAIVNETFAKRFFKDASPIGRRIAIGEDPGTPLTIEIVGLVKDSRYTAIREEPRPQVFFPYLQADIEGLTTYVRTDQGPEALMGNIRATIASIDPLLPVHDVTTMDERVDRSVANERLIASLSGTLSLLATVLSVVGLYGVIAYTVTRRTREIGIRMALGAMASRIAAGVLREAGLLVAIGLAIGFGTAWWLGRYVQSRLYGITAADPSTIALAALALVLVAGIAALIPARRASRVSPMAALRDE